MSANRQEIVAYHLSSWLLISLPSTNQFLRVAPWRSSTAVGVGDVWVATHSGFWAFIAYLFAYLVIDVLDIELQVLLILDINVVQELRSWVAAIFRSTRHLSTMKTFNVFLIHRRFHVFNMRVSRLHVSWIHTSCLIFSGTKVWGDLLWTSGVPCTLSGLLIVL